MEKYNYMFETVKKTLNYTSYNIQSRLYDSHSVLSSYYVSEIILTDDKRIPHISSRLLQILHRAKMLYCNSLTAYDLSTDHTPPDCLEFLNLCCNLAKRALLLFASVTDNKIYTLQKKHLIAETEDALSASALLRFSTLESYGKIFLALPHLELIYSCTGILTKIPRLCTAYDRVNNMFTLCT